MRIEFTFSRDAEYFRRQLLPGALLRTRLLRNLALFGIIVGATVGVAYRQTAAGLATGAGLVVAGLLVLLLRRWWIGRLTTMPEATHAPRRWLLTDDGMESSTDLTSVGYTWSTFRNGVVRDNAYLLYRDSSTVIDIPRAPLTAAQDSELHARLQALGLLGRAARR